MSQEKKKCHSILTEDFTKALKKTDSAVAKSIMKQIELLEFYENNPDLVPTSSNGQKVVPHLQCGKMLTSQNRNIYSLEPKLKIRALAHVTQRDGVKVYVWLWGGSHEEYNKLISSANLNKEERHSNMQNGQEINKQINDMSSNLSKDKVSANIQSIRDNSYSKGNKNNDKYKKS